MKTEYVIHQEEYEGLTIKILPDENAESPREWDNLGTMVCFHRRYHLGDDHKMSLEEARILQSEVEEGGGLVLPLYLYDHGGLTMNTTGFSCPWDSGCVGFIYVTAAKIREEFGIKRITKQVRERARRCLVAEVECYDQFLQGDVVGFTVCNADGDVLESCWGFYGKDDALSEAKSQVRATNQMRKEVLAEAEQSITGS